MQRALLSVSDKTGLVPLARGLADLGYELVSTGGTARTLAEAGLQVTGVADLTGFPEMLDGRVKTLHPAIHAGILYRRDLPAHRQAMAEAGLGGIDVVVVNLYPFRETVRSGAPFADMVEQIDIGGPTLVRAAAKNHEDVLVLVSPEQYADALRALQSDAGPSAALRLGLAAAAFRHVAAYDASVARVLTETAASRSAKGAPGEPAGDTASDGDDARFPTELSFGFERVAALRYGENPHQAAAVYADPLAAPGLARTRPLQGKALSYNNLNDAQAALDAVREFEVPAAVALKHATPCGVGVAETAAEAFRRARYADPISIFGGIVAFNREVDEETAQELNPIFLEVVLAPAFTDDARALLARKKNLRLLTTAPRPAAPLQLRLIDGGAVVQTADEAGAADEPTAWRVVCGAPTPEQLRALDLGWRVVKHVRSNAIVVASPTATLGIGGGQTNRVDAARQALERAGAAARGAVLASDAFFPFPDVVEAAAAAGIAAIVQPGGSKRDADSIAAAQAAGIAMCFTGRRHFKH